MILSNMLGSTNEKNIIDDGNKIKTLYMRLSDNVGNTPLIPITLGNLTVWGKAEFMNPGGSVKDRMASYILNNAEKE